MPLPRIYNSQPLSDIIDIDKKYYCPECGYDEFYVFGPDDEFLCKKCNYTGKFLFLNEQKHIKLMRKIKLERL